ncbi:hypothetical protein DSO57_1017575 [Entomophthora muscae]|uniref:Uncharacterized protein n=1 Tax=Entomophthora muscae TaxID=34485 RepID=A0ACC2UDU3_9FUNG|nr:hypothetical protein DSO57_1017575 [Entomophthora muscae]
MEQVLIPEPYFLRPASSEGQEHSRLHLINSKPERKFDANLPGLKSFPTSQGFVSKLPVPVTCDTGRLGSEISDSTNEKSPVPDLRPENCLANFSNTIAANDSPPIYDTRSFPEVATHDTGRLGGKSSKPASENCPKPSQSPGNSSGPENLNNINYQVIEKKGSKVYFIVAANGNLLPL